MADLTATRAGVHPALPSEFFKPDAVLGHPAEGELEGKSCGLAMDVDELAHAIGALLRGSGHDSVAHHASIQAGMAQHALGASLGYSPLATNSAGLAGVGAGSVFVGAASAAAMHAGLKEWRGAAEGVRTHKHAAVLLTGEKKTLDALDQATQARIFANKDAYVAAVDERIRAAEGGAAATKDGGLIGKYSFLSGSGLMARSIVEAGRNFGIAATGHTLHPAAFAASGAVAPSIMTGTGLLSNGFAMTASALAVALGVHFVRKTGKAHRDLREELPKLRPQWEKLTDKHPAYKKFLTAKSNQREQFMKSFAMKNRIFTAGAAIYSAGTILPAVVKMMVAAGVINSKKLGANLILGMFSIGIAGAIAMGVFSHQFLYGHPTLGRYENYATAHSVAFNRRLLSAVDTFRFNENGKELPLSVSEERGAALRASAFKMITAREAARTDLLKIIAADTGRTFAAFSHTGDDDYAEHRPIPTKIRAFVRGKTLRAKDVAAWLENEANAKTAAGACMRILEAECKHHVAEAQLVKTMAEQIHGHAGEAPVDSKISEFTTSYLGDGMAGIERAQRIKDNIAAFENAKTHADQKSAIEKFLRLQIEEPQKTADPKPKSKSESEKAESESEGDGSLKINEKTPLEHHFGKIWHGELAQKNNHERGTLLEIEREAGRLRPPVKEHPEFHVFR